MAQNATVEEVLHEAKETWSRSPKVRKTWYSSQGEKLPGKIIEHVLKAWDSGKTKGAQEVKKDIDHTKKVLLQEFSKNLNLAFKASIDLSEIIELKYGSKVIANRLKVNNINSFKSAIIIDKDFYLSEEYDKMLIECYAMEEDHSKEDLILEFTFMPGSEDLNVDMLISDGFIFDRKQLHG